MWSHINTRTVRQTTSKWLHSTLVGQLRSVSWSNQSGSSVPGKNPSAWVPSAWGRKHSFMKSLCANVHVNALNIAIRPTQYFVWNSDRRILRIFSYLYVIEGDPFWEFSATCGRAAIDDRHWTDVATCVGALRRTGTAERQLKEDGGGGEDAIDSIRARTGR